MDVEREQVAETSLENGGKSADYKVRLTAYSGPLDLLLYLIRKEEVDIYDIPVARVTEEYVKYLDLMSDMDLNIAGEFVVMAATLLEIKARMMAPDPVLEEDEEAAAEDPRMELVRRLMEYRRFKEAALALTERAQERAKQFSRPGERLNEQGERVAGTPKDVSVWMLLEAFSQVLQATGARGPHRVNLDAEPQAEINERLEKRVRQAGRIKFLEVFTEHTDRGILVGMFIGILELVRQQVMAAEQDVAFGPIWLTYIPLEEREQWEETAAAANEVEG